MMPMGSGIFVNIGSGNGLSSSRSQSIAGTNGDLLLIWPWEQN